MHVGSMHEDFQKCLLVFSNAAALSYFSVKSCLVFFCVKDS